MNARMIAAISLLLLLQSRVAAQESIDLESTFVGDREQPAVSYITP